MNIVVKNHNKFLELSALQNGDIFEFTDEPSGYYIKCQSLIDISILSLSSYQIYTASAKRLVNKLESTLLIGYNKTFIDTVLENCNGGLIDED